jgi:hypothetical protein
MKRAAIPLATVPLLSVVVAVHAVTSPASTLFFREDWKESPPATPVTQEHVGNPDLILGRHGPGQAQIRKSHHDQPADDPYYVWSGEAEGFGR